jgi:hypothetical protein
MTMNPRAGTGKKNECAEEDLEQFPYPMRQINKRLQITGSYCVAFTRYYPSKQRKKDKADGVNSRHLRHGKQTKLYCGQLKKHHLDPLA